MLSAASYGQTLARRIDRDFSPCHTAPMKPLLAATLAAALCGLGTPSTAQTFFRCTDDTGKVEFSDKGCKGSPGVPMVKPADPDAAALKTQSDARIQRDKALANQLEANRISSENAGIAAQQRQLQVDQGVAGRLAQERDARNAATVSVLPQTQLSDTAPVVLPRP